MSGTGTTAQDPWVTPKGAAEMLGISRQFFYAYWVTQHDLLETVHTVGLGEKKRRVKWRRSAIQSHLDRRGGGVLRKFRKTAWRKRLDELLKDLGSLPPADRAQCVSDLLDRTQKVAKGAAA